MMELLMRAMISSTTFCARSAPAQNAITRANKNIFLDIMTVSKRIPGLEVFSLFYQYLPCRTDGSVQMYRWRSAPGSPTRPGFWRGGGAPSPCFPLLLGRVLLLIQNVIKQPAQSRLLLALLRLRLLLALQIAQHAGNTAQSRLENRIGACSLDQEWDALT